MPGVFLGAHSTFPQPKTSKTESSKMPSNAATTTSSRLSSIREKLSSSSYSSLASSLDEKRPQSFDSGSSTLSAGQKQRLDKYRRESPPIAAG